MALFKQDLAAGRGGADRADGSLPTVDRLTALQRRERIIAVVRWLGVAFVALQVTVYQAPGPEFADAAAAARPLGYVVAAALAAVCVAVEVVLRKTRSEGALTRWGAVFLTADVAAVMAILYLYAFDPVSATWAVITVLPLEGALRFRLGGALAVWGAVAVLYPLRELYAAQAFGLPFDAPSVVYRLGLVLVIALFAGFMSQDLDLQLGLLQRLNDGSRRLASRLDPDEILQTLCQEARACLRARSAFVSVSEGGRFRPVASWPPEGLEHLLATGRGEPEDRGLLNAVLSGPVWIGRAGARPGRLIVPLRWQSDAMRHVLVIQPRGGRPSAFERQAAASLAEAAALALATTRVLQAEQRTSRRLRYLEALRTRFVATIAHDLRMPLTVFKGVSRMLRSRRDRIAPEQIDELLESVERQSNRLSRLADDLLDAARSDADLLTLYPQPCRLQTVVDATVADMEEDVTVAVPEDLSLVADPQRLERVVWNLLSNAEKYGKPPIEVAARRDGDRVRLTVRDHGAGLDDEQRSRLFSEFAGSDDPASVGLGLAIVWQLVEAHGGRITYDDARPGARFTVSLPADGPPAPADGQRGGENPAEPAPAEE